MIQDFGEKIHGAAKDRRQAYLENLRARTDDEIITQPLSKSFPEPNWQGLVDDGMDPWSVAFSRAARDTVPMKPKGWKINGWAASVRTLRNFVSDLLSGDVAKETLQARLDTPQYALLKAKLKQPIELYLALGHARSMKGIQVRLSSYSLLDGVRHDPPLSRWEVLRPVSKYRNETIGTGETSAAAIEAAREALTGDAPQKARKIPLVLYRRAATGDTVFIGRKIGKVTLDLASFPTVAEARKHLAEHYDDLVARSEHLKKLPPERRAENARREGVDLRDGRDITPEEFSATFGFRGVQFGNYVEKDRRQQDLNQAWDAFTDLAAVLECEPSALSLNGALALAFGARGSGGIGAAAAHYEPGQAVINLTKTRGAGSLAHEWFHALDNHLAKAAGDRTGYATGFLARQAGGLTIDDRQRVEAAIQVATDIRRTGIPARSRMIDQMRSTPYWGTMHEAAARCFEAWVIDELADRGIRNDYLANIVDEEVYEAEAAMMGLPAGRYPYPRQDEKEILRDSFASLFEGPMRQILPSPIDRDPELAGPDF